VTVVLLYTLGVLLMLVGIGVSIALHELGHMVPAKRFGVKVTRYMIGFGPTLFSRRRGETEYGVKLLPLGGFVTMPGMYPPRQETTRAGRPRRARLFERSMQEARDFSNSELEPGEEHRAFYRLSVPKRLVVMTGGPLTNLVLGVLILAISYLGIGFPAATTAVQTIHECAVPAPVAAERSQEELNDCQPGDQIAPAWDSGLQPGDTITAVAGQQTADWEAVSAAIREHAGERVTIDYLRGGQAAQAQVTIIENERYVTDEDGALVEGPDGEYVTETVGFLGISPAMERQPMPVTQFPGTVAETMGRIGHAIVFLPQRLVEIGQVALTDRERDPEGPMGLVGVGRIAGELAAHDAFDVVEKAQIGLELLGVLNLFLFAFNMVPLLPLDGGHIAVALYEGIRRRINHWRGRGPTGPFDTAKLLPLTYGVVALMLGMTLLLAYVDIVEPIRLFPE
jgi:membrane-associated protease RseP (regulator of RpoE activity)